MLLDEVLPLLAAGYDRPRLLQTLDHLDAGSSLALLRGMDLDDELAERAVALISGTVTDAPVPSRLLAAVLHHPAGRAALSEHISQLPPTVADQLVRLSPDPELVAATSRFHNLDGSAILDNPQMPSTLLLPTLRTCRALDAGDTIADEALHLLAAVGDTTLVERHHLLLHELAGPGSWQIVSSRLRHRLTALLVAGGFVGEEALSHDGAQTAAAHGPLPAAGPSAAVPPDPLDLDDAEVVTRLLCDEAALPVDVTDRADAAALARFVRSGGQLSIGIGEQLLARRPGLHRDEAVAFARMVSSSHTTTWTRTTGSAPAPLAASDHTARGWIEDADHQLRAGDGYLQLVGYLHNTGRFDERWLARAVPVPSLPRRSVRPRIGRGNWFHHALAGLLAEAGPADLALLAALTSTWEGTVGALLDTVAALPSSRQSPPGPQLPPADTP